MGVPKTRSFGFVSEGISHLFKFFQRPLAGLLGNPHAAVTIMTAPPFGLEEIQSQSSNHLNIFTTG